MISLLEACLRRVVLLVPFVLLLALGSASSARADEGSAREHFKRGVDLYDRKQYEPALEEFRAAYADKPSPGIKQNIALSLKGLGRLVEATTAFDEALDEGGATLKPETRAAMEQELAALSKLVATVRLRAVTAAEKKPVVNVTVVVDGAALSPAALHRPIRLEPGIHVFTAHADGLADPPEKKLSILAGSPVDATFEMGPPSGMLTIRPSVEGALVQVDGVTVGHGTWSGKVEAGTHAVKVLAAGFQTTSADVVVSSGAAVDYPIALQRRPDAPPEYVAPVRKPPPPQKKRYVVPFLVYEGQSFRLSPVLGEVAGGTKRAFTGAAGGVRGGYRISRAFAVEIYGDVGQLSATYRIASGADESNTTVIHWQLTPSLRFATGGPVRFTTATGFGAHGFVADAEIHTLVSTVAVQESHHGSGVSASWFADMGMQFDAGPTFLEVAVFADVNGVGSTKDDATDRRMFLSSPGARAGIRAGLGLQF